MGLASRSLKRPQRVADTRGVSTKIADLGLIPPARLGTFVAEVRRQSGLTREAASLSSGGRLSVTDLSMIERGRLICRESQLGAIEDVFGLRFGQAAPTRTRLIIDAGQGRLVMGGQVAQVMPDCSDDELLLRYLTLVYLCRRARPGTYVVPRSDDVDTLALVLDRPTVDIRQSLARLPHTERDVLRVAVRTASTRRLLPGLGLFVGMHARGALLMVDPETPQADLPTGHERVAKPSTTSASIVPFSALKRLRDKRCSLPDN